MRNKVVILTRQVCNLKVRDESAYTKNKKSAFVEIFSSLDCVKKKSLFFVVSMSSKNEWSMTQRLYVKWELVVQLENSTILFHGIQRRTSPTLTKNFSLFSDVWQRTPSALKRKQFKTKYFSLKHSKFLISGFGLCWNLSGLRLGISWQLAIKVYYIRPWGFLQRMTQRARQGPRYSDYFNSGLLSDL